MSRAFRLAVLSAFLIVHNRAQAPPAFEVASIKPHLSGGDSSDRKVLPGGRFAGVNVSVRTMIRIALGTEDSATSGAPRWIDTETYDIDAKTTGGLEITNRILPQLMLGLLKDRFGFQFHRESKESSIYWLTVAKGGAKLKGSTATELSMSTNTSGRKTTMLASKISMRDLAGALKRQTGRLVEDHTGLKGEFDMQLEWDKDDAIDSTGPSLLVALEEQLGLKLTAAKGVSELIVIDRIEKPSAN